MPLRRYVAGHAPDLFREPSRPQVCACGFTASTLDAVRAHARNPEPEPVWVPPAPTFGNDLTPAGKNAREGKPYRWHPWWKLVTRAEARVGQEPEAG